jgi:signal-transduction protein with cAMP-binding, CBS, and nucleotidyltransferase domain
MNLDARIGELLVLEGHDFWPVSPASSALDAALRMSQRGVDVLLIFEHGMLLGIVSEGDYARKVILKGKSPAQTLVREIMTSPVVTVDQGSTIGECLQLMTTRHIRYLPVIEGQTTVGLISKGDLVRAVSRTSASGANQLAWGGVWSGDLSGNITARMQGEAVPLASGCTAGVVSLAIVGGCTKECQAPEIAI